MPGPNGISLSDAGLGPNDFQAYPTLESVVTSDCGTTIRGYLQSLPNHRFTIDFYSVVNPDPSGHGEGDAFLADWQVETNASGLGRFVAFIPDASPARVSATTTDIVGVYNGFTYGNTSEFSHALVSTNATGCSIPPSATLAGPSVEVQPVDQSSGLSFVSLTFDQVLSAGETTVMSFDNGAQPPANFAIRNPPAYYEISTTAQFSGSVEICINYDESSVANESHLQFFHMENGTWTDRTSSLDTQANVICAVVTSLSPFAIFEATQLVSMQAGSDQSDQESKINLTSNGMLQVVLFTTNEFDAGRAIIDSMRLGNASVFNSQMMDFDHDGDLDLVVRFRIQDIGLLEIYRELVRNDMSDGILDSNVQNVSLHLKGIAADGLFEAFADMQVFFVGIDLKKMLASF